LSAQDTDGGVATDFMENLKKNLYKKAAVCDLQQFSQQIHD